MGNSNSHSDSNTERNQLHGSLDAFISNTFIHGIEIPSRIRKTLLTLLQEGQSQLSEWSLLSQKLSHQNYSSFIDKYLLVSGDLSELLDDIVFFLRMYKEHEHYALSDSSLFSSYLLNSMLISETLTIEQEFENITPNKRIPDKTEIKLIFNSSKLVSILLSNMFLFIFFGSSPSPLPVLKSKSNLLSKQSVFIFKSNIESRQTFLDLNFCSKRDGHSWASFVARYQNIGPSIIIIKDERGYVFGAFTSTSIQKSSKVSNFLTF